MRSWARDPTYGPQFPLLYNEIGAKVIQDLFSLLTLTNFINSTEPFPRLQVCKEKSDRGGVQRDNHLGDQHHREDGQHIRELLPKPIRNREILRLAGRGALLRTVCGEGGSRGVIIPTSPARAR